MLPEYNRLGSRYYTKEQNIFDGRKGVFEKNLCGFIISRLLVFYDSGRTEGCGEA